MRYGLLVFGFFFLATMLIACKKKTNSENSCLPDTLTVRQIVNKQAMIKLTAAIDPVYLVEEGTIDTRLIPCNLPQEFYQNDLLVTISGEVKATPQVGPGPCCAENFVITKITR